jgi:hypothetical protein
VSPRIKKLLDAVQISQRCMATHVESVPVREMFGDKVAWEGVVEVFDISKHPRATRCYAWSYGQGKDTQYVIALGVPPVVSAQTAVRASVIAEARKKIDPFGQAMLDNLNRAALEDPSPEYPPRPARQP